MCQALGKKGYSTANYPTPISTSHLKMRIEFLKINTTLTIKNGAIKVTGTIKNDRRIGSWQFYDSTGDLKERK